MSKLTLEIEDVQRAAEQIGVEYAALQAVIAVESAGDGFLPDCRPKVLFEAHVFSKLTAHRFDKSHPHISSRKWNRKLYGAPGAHQWDRLNEAILLDREAALKSASFGAAQLMGFNHEACGFPTVEEFLTAMLDSAASQMNAFIRFLESQGLIVFLKTKNWTRFAERYNGPSFKSNRYDEKLEREYKRYLKA